jgi:hypothetical protein
MPRGSRSISIEGQFAREVLGTFHIIRGFADLQDLATISAPYRMDTTESRGEGVRGYQRDIDPEHAAAIKRYLEDGTLRFIPEVILSIRADFRDEVDAQQHVVGVISDGTPGLRVKRRWKSRNVRTHQITVDKDKLADLLGAEPRIRRIDGNHRLHLAAELRAETTSPNKYLAPFCAVLLAPPGDGNDDYVESMLFHTINSTSLPLDSEHALQLALRQRQDLRPAAAVEFAASPPLFLTRLINQQMDQMPRPQRERLGPTPATVLHLAAKAMIAEDTNLAQTRATAEAFAGELCGALSDILTRLHAFHPDFCKADFFIELAALAWKETDAEHGHDQRVNEAVRTLEAMGRWLGRDGLHRLQTRRSLAQQIFEIFCTVRSRVPKRIFLSRWYPTDADGDEKRKADLRLREIKQAIKDLVEEGIVLALDDPGTETGATFPIHQKMYEALAANDIVLVDLSGVRPNVSIEAGYALERHKSNRLLFLFQPTQQTPNNPKFDNPPFDLSTFRYEKVTDAAEIPDKLKPHLRAIWQEAMTEGD